MNMPTPWDVIAAIYNWIHLYLNFAPWGWWSLIIFVALVCWEFSRVCAELGIDPFAIPVVVVNDKEDK